MPRRIATLVVVLSSIVVPGIVLAQSSLTVHASRGSTQSAPWLYGASIGVSSHGLGLRVSGAAGHANPPDVGDDRALLWMTDADLVLAPTRLGGDDRTRSVVPYAFVGAGMQPRSGNESVANALPHWSWGGGLTIPILSSVALIGEARSRTLFDRETLGAISTERRSTELRVGLALGFGGGSDRRGSSARTESTPSRRSPTATRPVLSIPGSALGTQVLPTARRYLGVDYRYGGTSPATGFDCSGFVQYVFARHDVQLPRTSRQQAGAGSQLEPRVTSLRAGDLMFFAEPGAKVSHVAIYVGDNRIIHATSSGGNVRYDELSSSRGRWFATRLVSARRITNAGAGLADLVRALETGTIDVKALQLDPPDKAPPPR